MWIPSPTRWPRPSTRLPSSNSDLRFARCGVGRIAVAGRRGTVTVQVPFLVLYNSETEKMTFQDQAQDGEYRVALNAD